MSEISVSNSSEAPEQQIASGFLMERVTLQETVADPFTKHQDVIDRTVDVEVLTTNDNNLGSLRIDTIYDMSVLPMGNRVGLEADFRNIDSLKRATLEHFDAFKQKIATAPEHEKLRDKLARLTPEQHELELQVFFATGLAVEYFGKYKEDGHYTEEEVAEKKIRRDQTYDLKKYMIDPLREDSLKIKPLSEAGDEAMCTEYAVFVKEALHRLGTDFSYVAAEKQHWSDMPSFYHSFLVSADGKTVIDPLETGAHYGTGLSYGVYTLQESFYDSDKPVAATGSWNSSTNVYSLSRIEVPAAQAA
jgi:hypothetical protein